MALFKKLEFANNIVEYVNDFHASCLRGLCRDLWTGLISAGHLTKKIALTSYNVCMAFLKATLATIWIIINL
jgi:hypothetical protein